MTLPSPAPAPVAFFDVDETLISVNGMARFLRHHMRSRGQTRAAFEDAVRDLRALGARGASREEIARAYYRLYAGCDERELAAEGREWFAAELRSGGLFLADSVAALREHRRRAEPVVLVSGSFAPCLDPVAERLGVEADAVLCARPKAVDGVLTGAVDVTMTGEEKAVAVRALLRERGVRPDGCHAYGDHASDLAMLRAVGHPVVVGADPVLLRHAEAGGWRRLPGAASAGHRGAPAGSRTRASREWLGFPQRRRRGPGADVAGTPAGGDAPPATAAESPTPRRPPLFRRPS
ncbi:HAD-IB family hydrolase [Streptomyces sp. NPDC059900]|uniref:HAD family hydrolase n=1 Tax=Streptomyces sp. NPDC059900 TaxID=3155816 RepID=UPI00342BD321